MKFLVIQSKRSTLTKGSLVELPCFVYGEDARDLVLAMHSWHCKELIVLLESSLLEMCPAVAVNAAEQFVVEVWASHQVLYVRSSRSEDEMSVEDDNERSGVEINEVEQKGDAVSRLQGMALL